MGAGGFGAGYRNKFMAVIGARAARTAAARAGLRISFGGWARFHLANRGLGSPGARIPRRPSGHALKNLSATWSKLRFSACLTPAGRPALAETALRLAQVVAAEGIQWLLS
jgi:hypothetical protein